jgi:hypothetical protein
MAKIKLGSPPKNFRHVVKFPMLDGSEGAIEVSFVYRTRKQFGEFIDSLVTGAKDAPTDGEAFSMARLMAKAAGSNADYIMRVADGWNLDEPFNLETVGQLADEIPAAATAIMEAYSGAVQNGRLGN